MSSKGLGAGKKCRCKPEVEELGFICSVARSDLRKLLAPRLMPKTSSSDCS